MFKILSALGIFIKRNAIVSFIVYIAIIIAVSFLTSWIYNDYVAHAIVVDNKKYLSLALISKWLIILITISFCTFKIFSLFKKEQKNSKSVTKEPISPLENDLLSSELENPKEKIYEDLKKDIKKKKEETSDISIEERLLTADLKSKGSITLNKNR